MFSCTEKHNVKYNQTLCVVSWQQRIVLLLWVTMCQTFVLFNA